MTSRDFVYWLQGLFELTDPPHLDVRQTALIKAHLALVFKHELDPSMGDAQHQQELNKIHGSLEEALKHETGKVTGNAHLTGIHQPGVVMRC